MTIARRDFLRGAGLVSVAGLAQGSVAVAQQHTALAESVGLDRFEFDPDKVPMNAANLCPMPGSVSQANSDIQASLDRDMSGANRNRFRDYREKARTRIADLLGTHSDEIALLRNTSEANNVIVRGLPLATDDEVLLWDENHPSNGIAWDVRAQRDGFRTRRFSVPRGLSSPDEVIAHITSHIGPKTRVVSFTHISNITGFRLPLAELCETVKKRGDIYIHVDGAQTWGAVDINLHDSGCDSFSASSHKWFMGPRETGILYVRDRHIGAIQPLIVSLPWGNDIKTTNQGARKFEALGQRDTAAMAALDAAVAYHEKMSPTVIERRSGTIADYLREGLIELGLSFVSPLNPAFKSNVVILRGKREQLPELVDRILEDAGIIVAPVNGLRLSPHVYNTADHVDRVVASIRKHRHLLPAV